MEHGQQLSSGTETESKASAAIGTLQREASQLTSEVKREASEMLEQRVDKVFSLFDDIASAVRAAARELENEHHPRLAQYVNKAAEEVAHARSRFQSTDINELLASAENLARTRPVAVLATAFAAGFAFVRFLKSTAPELTSRHDGDGFRNGGYDDESAQTRRSGRGSQGVGSSQSYGSSRDYRPKDARGEGRDD